jgi:uncharacterized protein YecA (UPF0149 family)
MFQTLLGAIRSDIVNTYLKVTIQKNTTGDQKSEEKKSVNQENVSFLKPGPNTTITSSSQNNQASSIKHQASDKVGRNDPCPCGSGKKYKKCHGK